MTKLEHFPLDSFKTFYRICREDLAYALCELGQPNMRIQGTIEMLTELLDDEMYWKAFKQRWNVPWDDGPIRA